MIRVWFLLLVLSISVQAQSLTPEDLKGGGYVIYFRHTSATLGADCKDSAQAEWWKSDDPKKSRQLDAQGREQARYIGEVFSRLGLEVDRVLCSEFRRTQDAATAMNLGPVTRSEQLTPLAYPGRMEEKLQPLFEQAPEKGKNTVLVAHGHVTVLFEQLGHGDAAVFKPGASPLFQGFIPYRLWEEAYRRPPR